MREWTLLVVLLAMTGWAVYLRRRLAQVMRESDQRRDMWAQRLKESDEQRRTLLMTLDRAVADYQEIQAENAELRSGVLLQADVHIPNEHLSHMRDDGEQRPYIDRLRNKIAHRLCEVGELETWEDPMLHARRIRLTVRAKDLTRASDADSGKSDGPAGDLRRTWTGG
jgi:hypothetical protein